MKDIDKLKQLNILERAGFFIKRNPGKTIALFVFVVLISALALLSPQLISLSRLNSAEAYVNNAASVLEDTGVSIEKIKNKINGNKQILKGYKEYCREVSGFENTYSGFQEELGRCKARLSEKDSEYVLKVFSHYKEESENRVLLQDRMQQLGSIIENLSVEINEIIKLDQELKRVYLNLSGLSGSMPGEYEARKEKLEQISGNGKNPGVKNNTKGLFNTISSGKDTFSSYYSTVPIYSEAAEGKYSLEEMNSIKEMQSKASALYGTFKNSLSRFDSYWNELQDQYFTVVSKHFKQKSVEHIIEPNPEYREWTETETYRDSETRYRTETYTERVYVGSRIIGDTEQDIYEMQTRTREVPYQEWVDKTRQVTKNNGQPREISVPYDVYEFYLTVEVYRPEGNSTIDRLSGKKHEKFDTSIQSWNYKKDEEIGYTVWKQKWNDEAGLITGKGIKAHLEK